MVAGGRLLRLLVSEPTRFPLHSVTVEKFLGIIRSSSAAFTPAAALLHSLDWRGRPLKTITINLKMAMMISIEKKKALGFGSNGKTDFGAEK